MTTEDLTCGNVLYPTSVIPRQFGSTECNYKSVADVYGFNLFLIDPLFTAYASHLVPTEEYIYLGSAEGCLYKLVVLTNGDMHWIPIQQTNPISQSMCILGTINMIEQDGRHEVTNADILLYAGESADSQVLAVKFGYNSLTLFIYAFLI